MKKLALIILILSTFILVSCGSSDTGGGDEGEDTGNSGGGASVSESAEVEVFMCTDDDLGAKSCSATPLESNLAGVFQVNGTLCAVAAGAIDKENFDLEGVLKKEYAYSKIVDSSNDNGVGELVVELRETGESEDTEDTVESRKTIDLMFDLTHYDVGNKEIEKKVITNRMKSMFDYLDGKNSIDGLEKGDNLILRFIGTMDYGTYPAHKNDVLKDKIFYTYGQVEQKKVETLNNEKHTIRILCEKNRRSGKESAYVKVLDKEIVAGTSEVAEAGEEEETNAKVYADKNDIYEDMQKQIAARYGKNSYGTYLIESFYNNTDFIALDEVEEDDVTLVFSDFRFQLHPKMKANRKDTIGTANWNFPPVTLSMWDEGSDYHKFYTETVPKYLADKCEDGQNLYLVGLELDDDLDRQIIMKEYYKDVLFKDCNVKFK